MTRVSFVCVFLAAVIALAVDDSRADCSAVRCKMFVGWLVAHSLKIQRGTRKPILDVDGNKQYMSSTTLLKVMQNLFKMASISSSSPDMRRHSC